MRLRHAAHNSQTIRSAAHKALQQFGLQRLWDLTGVTRPDLFPPRTTSPLRHRPPVS